MSTLETVLASTAGILLALAVIARYVVLPIVRGIRYIAAKLDAIDANTKGLAELEQLHTAMTQNPLANYERMNQLDARVIELEHGRRVRQGR